MLVQRKHCCGEFKSNFIQSVCESTMERFKRNTLAFIIPVSYLHAWTYCSQFTHNTPFQDNEASRSYNSIHGRIEASKADFNPRLVVGSLLSSKKNKINHYTMIPVDNLDPT